jgi:hypothetical protein
MHPQRGQQCLCTGKENFGRMIVIDIRMDLPWTDETMKECTVTQHMKDREACRGGSTIKKKLCTSQPIYDSRKANCSVTSAASSSEVRNVVLQRNIVRKTMFYFYFCFRLQNLRYRYTIRFSLFFF